MRICACVWCVYLDVHLWPCVCVGTSEAVFGCECCVWGEGVWLLCYMSYCGLYVQTVLYYVQQVILSSPAAVLQAVLLSWFPCLTHTCHQGTLLLLHTNNVYNHGPNVQLLYV